LKQKKHLFDLRETWIESIHVFSYVGENRQERNKCVQLYSSIVFEMTGK
jgi:hypothetical protein